MRLCIQNACFTISLFLIAVLMPTPGYPLFGIEESIGIGCIIDCGDQGFVNPHFLGDTVNQQFTQASIDKFEEAGVRVVNLADQKLNDSLNQKIAQADALLQARLADLNADITQQRQALMTDLAGVSRQLISELDDTIRKNIADGDIILESRFGNINTIAENQTILFKKAIQELIIIGAALAIIIYVCIQVLKIDFANISVRRIRDTSWLSLANMRAAIGRFFLVTAVTGVCALAGYSVVSALATRDQQALREAYLHNYESKLTDFNFRYASYNASQLQVLDPSNDVYEALSLKANILRVVLANPYSYSSSGGYAELISKIRKVESINARYGRDPDPDMATITAFVMWQRGSDSMSRYAAASLAAITLNNNKGRDWPTRPLARYFVAMYSANPIRDAFLRKAGFVKDDANAKIEANEWASAIKGFRYLGNEEILGTYKSISMDVADVDPRSPFAAYIYYGRVYTIFQKTVSSAYSTMVLANYRASIEAGQQQVDDIALRNASADKIMVAFAEYMNGLRNPILDETNLRQRSLTGLFAYYLRASEYKKLADTVVAIPLATPISPADVGTGIHTVWIDTFVVPSVQAGSAAFIATAAKFDTAEEQKKLIEFETAIANFFVAVKSARELGGPAVEVAKAVDIAHAAAVIASELQLVVCEHGVSGNLDATCSSFDDQTDPAAVSILANISRESIIANIEGWTDAFQGYLRTRYASAT